MSRKRLLKTTATHSAILQRKKETLREYIDRFTTEAVQVIGVSDKLKCWIFKEGLMPDNMFREKLDLEELWSMSELLACAQPYINYEEEIRELVSRTKLSVNVMDRWKWSTLEYTVKEAYKVIIEGLASGEGERNAYDTDWNRLVPLKVSVFVWRLLQNKIPTRDNLIKRGILDVSQNSSPFHKIHVGLKVIDCKDFNSSGVLLLERY